MSRHFPAAVPAFATPFETILVVDDNPAVLSAVCEILADAGFLVLSACDPAGAIKISHHRAARIDLLLTDIEMPYMTGPALGELLKADRPDLHVMMMSGGAPNGNLLVLNYGWAYIQKPFIAAKLVQMLKEVLRSVDRAQPGGHEFDSRKDTDGKLKAQ